jgi:hypothetical protein
MATPPKKTSGEILEEMERKAAAENAAAPPLPDTYLSSDTVLEAEEAAELDQELGREQERERERAADRKRILSLEEMLSAQADQIRTMAGAHAKLVTLSRDMLADAVPARDPLLPPAPPPGQEFSRTCKIIVHQQGLSLEANRPVPVWINGKQWVIPRGEVMEVPVEVALVLADARVDSWEYPVGPDDNPTTSKPWGSNQLSAPTRRTYQMFPYTIITT